MRSFYFIPMALLVSSCGIPPADLAIGAGVGYALYGDEIETIDPENPPTVHDAVPPQADYAADKVATNVRDNVRHNARRLKEWWFYDPKKEAKQAAAVPHSYCYRVLHDIVCYPQEMPGWEGRLVGYQGAGAPHPGYVKTKPLPQLAQGAHVPAPQRIKQAAPVFEEIPEEIKKQPVGADQPTTGAAQEILPDPLISPQL